jgi:hypothetical protein
MIPQPLSIATMHRSTSAAEEDPNPRNRLLSMSARRARKRDSIPLAHNPKLAIGRMWSTGRSGRGWCRRHISEVDGRARSRGATVMEAAPLRWSGLWRSSAEGYTTLRGRPCTNRFLRADRSCGCSSVNARGFKECGVSAGVTL